VPSAPSVSELGDRVRGWLRREPKVVVPRTIFVVDGDSANRQSTARLVESLGYEPVQCRGIGDAMKELDDHEPSFVLLGFELDDGSGIEALGKLREEDPDLSVIMLASNLWDSRAADAMRKGAVAYLARPFGADELREVLGRH
jgi:DNA-binding NtrC family response regulator